MTAVGPDISRFNELVTHICELQVKLHKRAIKQFLFRSRGIMKLTALVVLASLCTITYICTALGKLLSRH